MENEITMPSILATGTSSLKLVNQDRCFVSRGNINAIAVADGIGSLAHAHLGAERVVRRAEELLRDQTEEVDLQQLFAQIQNDLDTWIAKLEPGAAKGSFGTTLILAVETPTKVIFGYIGNGAILHIRGNITRFQSKVYYLPWICVNHLNPHSMPVGGKPALTRHFGNGMSLDKVAPTIFEIEKDSVGSGDIFVLCTDGIYSIDQAVLGRDENDDIWWEGSRSVELLLIEIRSFLESEEHHDDALQRTIKHFLNELRTTSGLMNDDCTLGVIVTEQAIQFQKNNIIDAIEDQ